MIDKQILNVLKREEAFLNTVINKVEKALMHAPEGQVLVKKYKMGLQFYFRKNAQDRYGTYMPVTARKRAVALVQKSYIAKVLAAAKKQHSVINRFLRQYNPNALADVFERESILRQPLLDPLELPDEQYASAWQAAEYKKKEFLEDTPEHFTNKHERVRSKSEVLIANTLFRSGIPYRYECPLQLGNATIHPDFTILRMRDRKELYWEHLGMMDESGYRNDAFRRIREYESHGLFVGTDLILTIETSRMPLNTITVQRMIDHYLL